MSDPSQLPERVAAAVQAVPDGGLRAAAERVVSACIQSVGGTINDRASAAELRHAADAFERRGSDGDATRAELAGAAALAREVRTRGDLAQCVLRVLRAAPISDEVLTTALVARD